MNTVLLEIDEHIALVTINRPSALNALSIEVLSDLEKTFDELQTNKNIYAVILTGSGEKSFVAGADISEMKDKDEKDAEVYGIFGNNIFLKIENFRCPIIACINGFALGGGLELALSCDIRIASSNARFALPETSLGITPGFGGTQRLSRLIGSGRAKELIFTCRQIKADEALQIGLVNKVVELNELMNEAKDMARTIAKNAPIAVKQAKKSINDGGQCDIENAIKIEAKNFSKCFSTDDQKMAMTAFLNKEKIAMFNNR